MSTDHSVSFDILGLGAVTIDHLLYVDEYPTPDTKLQVRGQQRQLGGLTAIALLAAARFGARCAYAGALGDDPLSHEAIQIMSQYGIDLSHLVRRDDARPIDATIIVTSRPPTRTILFDASHVNGADPQRPAPEIIRQTRVLFVDHLGPEGTIRAARIARAARIPVVADYESDAAPGFPDMLALADHLILSQHFAARITGEADPALIARKLWAADRQAVVITCGTAGAWYADSADGEARFQPAYQVETVDSTGCGDVFHGVYAALLARGLDVAARVRYAAAAAALKAASPVSGPAGIPSQAAVEAFLRQRGE